MLIEARDAESAVLNLTVYQSADQISGDREEYIHSGKSPSEEGSADVVGDD